MSQCVALSESGNIAQCTLNLPEKRNPISAEMRATLIQTMESVRSKESVRAVLITGAGSAFCSGLDLESLSAQSTFSAKEHLADSESIASFFRYIAAYPKPTIAAVNGPAVAGGCGLALLCDLTVVSSEAYFCFSEVKIGFVPAIVGMYLERLVGPKVSRDLLLTARRVPAEEAFRLGMVNRVVPPAELLNESRSLADLMIKNSQEAVTMTKTLLYRTENISFDESLTLAVDINARARSTEDCKEGVRAFLEKRPPKWSR